MDAAHAYMEGLYLLLLASVIAAAAFYAGWKSAQAHLNAALTVSDITNAVAKDGNSVSAALDRFTADAASLRKAILEHQSSISERQRAVEEVLEMLFQGFERAGYVGRSRKAAGSQVGETPSE